MPSKGHGEARTPSDSHGDAVDPSPDGGLAPTALGDDQEVEAGTLDPPTSKKLVRALIARDFWLSKETDKTHGGG